MHACESKCCKVLQGYYSNRILKKQGEKLGSKQKYLNLSDKASKVLENSTASKFLALHSFSSLPIFFSLVFSVESYFASLQQNLHTFSSWLLFSLTVDCFVVCTGSLPVSTIADFCPGDIEARHSEHCCSGWDNSPGENIKEIVFP